MGTWLMTHVKNIWTYHPGNRAPHDLGPDKKGDPYSYRGLQAADVAIILYDAYSWHYHLPSGKLTF